MGSGGQQEFALGLRFDALKNQTVDHVFTIEARIRNCLRQLYAKDITSDDKQELDEALQREEILDSLNPFVNIIVISHGASSTLLPAPAVQYMCWDSGIMLIPTTHWR